MTDYYLRTDTKQQMDAALAAAGLVVGGRTVDGVYIDMIGRIPCTLDYEGNEVKPADTRFHANVRVVKPLTAAQVSSLPLVSPLPAVPYRMFA